MAKAVKVWWSKEDDCFVAIRTDDKVYKGVSGLGGTMCKACDELDVACDAVDEWVEEGDG